MISERHHGSLTASRQIVALLRQIEDEARS